MLAGFRVARGDTMKIAPIQFTDEEENLERQHFFGDGETFLRHTNSICLGRYAFAARRPFTFVQGRLCCGKEGTYFVRYPALSRPVPQSTRDGSARAGLNNYARPKKRGGAGDLRDQKAWPSLSELY